MNILLPLFPLALLIVLNFFISFKMKNNISDENTKMILVLIQITIYCIVFLILDRCYVQGFEIIPSRLVAFIPVALLAFVDNFIVRKLV